MSIHMAIHRGVRAVDMGMERMYACRKEEYRRAQAVYMGEYTYAWLFWHMYILICPCKKRAWWFCQRRL